MAAEGEHALEEVGAEQYAQNPALGKVPCNREPWARLSFRAWLLVSSPPVAQGSHRDGPHLRRLRDGQL